MRFFVEQCPWYLAGPLLGLLVVGMRWAGNLHLGALGSFVATQGWVARPLALPGWRVFFFAGTIAGGLAYALASGGLHGGPGEAAFANGGFDRMGLVAGRGLAARAAVLGAAGLLIGFGARTAGGCTSGHGVCGVAQLSPGSVASTVTFVLVAIGVAHFLPAASPLAALLGAP